MPNKKKKLFNKNNSVKFLLLPGNTQAVNADGETLENVLVPVSRNYKAGTSLLMSSIGALCDSEPGNEDEKEVDLEKIMGEFDDADSEITIEELPLKMEKLKFSGTASKKFKSFGDFDIEEDDDDDDDDEYVDANSEFSYSNSDDDDQDSIEDDKVVANDMPEAIKMFNEKFERVLEEYEEDQIGALDFEDICGYISTSSKRAKDLMNSEALNEREQIEFGNYDEDIKEKILNYADDSGDEKLVKIVIEKPIEFDCESILSTYSNIYNHPTVIKEERVKKIRVPNNPLKKRLTKSQLKTLDKEKDSEDESDDNISVSTTFNVRVKGETPEQKRERKAQFREAKRISRMLKKENKLAFKKEKKIQTCQNINAQRNAGIRLL